MLRSIQVCFVLKGVWSVVRGVSFQCRGVLLILTAVGQGPTALAVGAGGVCLDICILICQFFSFSLSLRDGPTEILSQRAV